jgi:hypothetical protein
MIRSSAVLIFFGFVAGCAPQTTQMEACPNSKCGPTPANVTNSDSAPPEKLRKQAAFDLQCGVDKLGFTAIDEEHWYADVRSWGVRGCGKQASYALEQRCGNSAAEACNWYLNSPIQSTSPTLSGSP